MSQSLTLEQAAAFAPHRSFQPSCAATRTRSPGSTATVLPFVERRQADQLTAAGPVRSPLVLTFAGVMSGLLLSAILIALVALVLTVCAVSWSNASQHCIATVIFVFGTAGLVLYWDAAHAQTRILAWIEPAIERRAYYLHLSSLDALENIRNLNNWARTEIPASDSTPSRRPQRATVQPIRPLPDPAQLSAAESACAATRGDARYGGRWIQATADCSRPSGQPAPC